MPLIFYVILLFALLQAFSFINYRLLVHLNLLKHSILIGICVHEFSHYLACKLTLTPVKRVCVNRRGGYVIHGSSKIPLVGNIIISLAPLFVGLLLLVYIIYLLIGDNNLFLLIFDSVKVQDWSGVYDLLKGWLFGMDFADWKFWALSFVFLNIVAVITPSKKDYKNIFFGIVIYVVLSYFFRYFDVVNIYLIYTLILTNFLIFLAILISLMLNFLKRIVVFL